MKKIINFCLLFVLTLLLCVVLSPAIANISRTAIINQDSQSKILESQKLYESGRFAEAVQVLQQAVQAYQQQGDTLKQSVALSNLSLAYQQLGNWQQAQIAITNSLDLQGFQPLGTTNKNLAVLAQTLDIEGRLQLLTGKPEAALSTWKQTEDIYTKLGDKNGIALALLYQAQALRNRGFNKQAIKKLEQVNQTLASQGDSLAKATVLLSLGDTLENVGESEKSRLALEQSLTIYQSLKSPENIASSLLSLGNNARNQQKFSKRSHFTKKHLIHQLHPSQKFKQNSIISIY